MNRLWNRKLAIYNSFGILWNNFYKTPSTFKFSTTASTESTVSASEQTDSKTTPENNEKDAQINSLLEKVTDLEDKYKRALAETENTRQRLVRQIEDAKIFGIQSFCKDLLEVADILHKAKESLSSDQLEKNEHLKAYQEGLIMTEARLLQVFKQHGLVQIDALGKKFDPNEHESLFEVECTDKPAGSVAVVTKIGYKLHNRTIRPASVGLAKSTS